MKERLSEEQLRVVRHPAAGGHLFVRAAPGSGKTRVVCERIAHLLRGGVAPDAVLAMTFSRQAAEGLRHRLGGVDVRAGTFHSVCADILGDHGTAVGVRRPLRILDETRQGEVIAAALARAGVALPEEDRQRDRILREAKERIGKAKRRGVEDFAAVPGQQLPDDLMAVVADAYRARLADLDALDFDDLILRALELLDPGWREGWLWERRSASAEARREEATRHGDSVAAHYWNRLRFVFVDEFHDVSPEQYALLRALAPANAPDLQVMAVADPDQAIYGWREAGPALLDRFVGEYRPAQFRLTWNYRSTPEIVRCAGAILGDAGRSALRGVERDASHPVACLAFAAVEDEADGLVRLIGRARSAGDYGYGDIAVLCRTHKRADVAETALLEAGIPLTRVQPGRFYARPDAQDTLRFLELGLALHDDGFAAALNWPRVAVDEVTMVHLRRLAEAEGVALCDLARGIDRYGDRVTPLTRVAVGELLATIETALAPVLEEPIDRILDRVLPALAGRRSPIPRGERDGLRGVLASLDGHLRPRAEALTAAVVAGRPVRLCPDGSLDADLAAELLRHALERYLRHPVERATLCATDAGGDDFTVVLGEDRSPDGHGFGLGVRRTRAYAYSVGTLAWRLGQLLLMSFERLDREPFVLFDLETSGRHAARAEIVEVAALRFRDGQPEEGALSCLVRPSGPAALEAGAIRVHGLTWAKLQHAPAPGEALPRLLEWLGDATLVGHNIESFDYPVLVRAARAAGLPPPRHHLIDTVKMARRLLPDERSHRLEDLARKIDPGAVQRHRAEDDVLLNAGAFQMLLETLRADRALDALSEALPLVAMSIAAAGVPARVEHGLRDENALLADAGARAFRNGLGRQAARAWADRSPAGDALLDWLRERGADASGEDAEWAAFEGAWRETADRYCAVAAERGLEAFLRHAALAESIDYLPALADGGEPDPRRLAALDRVTMMTVHAAKGKEWPVVFVIGAEDGEMPAWWAGQDEAALAEERRVLYVAMTRAQRRLCLLWARETHGRNRSLSRFLGHVPPGVLECGRR